MLRQAVPLRASLSRQIRQPRHCREAVNPQGLHLFTRNTPDHPRARTQASTLRSFTSTPTPSISDALRTEAHHSNQALKLETLFNVHGKVALITGGGSGIGLMATQALAVNGAKVYITGRTRDKLDRVADLYGHNIPGQIIPLTADITDKQSIAQLVQEIAAREDHLSILVNNAGIAGHTQPVGAEDADAASLRRNLFDDPAARMEEWDAVFRTNVAGVFFTTTAFLPLLARGTEHAQHRHADKHGWSSTIINISSISGIVKSSQHHFAYNASKAAAIHLTKMLAQEISASGLRIRVNNIAPGVFPSEMTAGASDAKQKSFIASEKYEQKVPVGRPGRDEALGGAVLFAVTNQYLHGQTVVVDGGYVLAMGGV